MSILINESFANATVPLWSNANLTTPNKLSTIGINGVNSTFIIDFGSIGTRMLQNLAINSSVTGNVTIYTSVDGVNTLDTIFAKIAISNGVVTNLIDLTSHTILKRRYLIIQLSVTATCYVYCSYTDIVDQNSQLNYGVVAGTCSASTGTVVFTNTSSSTALIRSIWVTSNDTSQAMLCQPKVGALYALPTPSTFTNTSRSIFSAVTSVLYLASGASLTLNCISGINPANYYVSYSY